MRTALLLLLLASGAAHAADSPVGRWQTLNRSDNSPAGVVRLQIVNGELDGWIDQIYDPARRALRCTRCDGPLRDQPFQGLQILHGLHPDGDVWDGGTVLDPDTGRTYKASVRMIDPGHLVIRGYVGISLFGGSQTWTRVD